jgi:IS30 family transposase
MATWFCDAYASWQKGGVENANGRLRRWLPRHIDIDRLSDEEIQDRENVSASRRPSRRSSKSLAKTPKSASLEPVALRARIYGPIRPVS